MGGSVLFWGVCSRCLATWVGAFFVRAVKRFCGERAENKSGDTMTFKLHDISLFEQDT